MLSADPQSIAMSENSKSQILSILTISYDLGRFDGYWQKAAGGTGGDSLIINIFNASGVTGPPVILHFSV